MKHAKKKAGVYAYLEMTNVLETEDNSVIEAARKAYWKEYKSKWRKAQRSETKAFTVICTKAEAHEITTAARIHKRSPSKFIKEACLNGYMRRQYVVPDIESLNLIRQLLAVNYNTLQRLFDENKLPLEAGRQVLALMQTLEHTILSELHHPKRLKQ